MKKIILIILLICTFLVSCTKNEIYEYNKQVLDKYSTSNDYAFLTYDRYESQDKSINFKKLINRKLILDGKGIELIYNTRYQQTLVEDSLYFCYEYKREDKIGHHALGYVDINTRKVYVDYFDYERYIFDYNFSTDEFVCYTFKKETNGLDVIDIVFFKDTNKLKFDYNLGDLSYSLEDVEEPNLKDYYIENDVRYVVDSFNRKLTNSVTGEVIEMQYQNDLLELDTVIKEIYSQFQDDISYISARYLSTGEELFLCIHDRPINRLIAPYMVFKCNLDLSEVEYIGYSEYSIREVIKLT